MHNNPGQYVIPGGHCKKSVIDDKLIKSSIREFVEETGNYINRNSITLKRYNDFSISYYRISGNREYEVFKRINDKADEEHKELNELNWFDLEKVITMMNPKNKQNLPCSGRLESTTNSTNKSSYSVHQYIKDWSKNNWDLKKEMKNFKVYSEGEIKSKITYKQYDMFVKEIRKNLKRSRNYNLLKNYLIKEFNKRSHTDWYYKSAIHLSKNINTINDDINKNILKIKSPAKIKTLTPLKPKKTSVPKYKAKKTSYKAKKTSYKAKKTSPKYKAKKFVVNRTRPIKQSLKTVIRGRFERY